MTILATFIQHRIEVPNHNNQTRKINSWFLKEKNQHCQFADDMTYIKNPKDATHTQTTRTHQWNQ